MTYVTLRSSIVCTSWLDLQNVPVRRIQLTACCRGFLKQGQVTRAQEAEENYVIKRELAVVRQQCSAASENLEKAQDTIRELQQQQVRNRSNRQLGCCCRLCGKTIRLLFPLCHSTLKTDNCKLCILLYYLVFHLAQQKKVCKHNQYQ